MSNKVKLFLTLLPLILFLALLFSSFNSRQTMGWFFARTSYYFIFALCILWLIQLIGYLTVLRFSLRKLVSTYWPGIAVALVLTSIVFTTVPVQFKILGDETNLLSVSQSMFFDKSAYIISMAKYDNGNFQTVAVDIPNRPLLFPFVISLFHAVFNYHPENVFVLNFLIMFILLTGVNIAIRKAVDANAAIAGMFFILAYPIVSISATSGGYDLFSTTFFALILVVFYHFLKSTTTRCAGGLDLPASGGFTAKGGKRQGRQEPQSLRVWKTQSPHPEGFAFLWASLLMFANIRYESCIFFVIIVIAAIKYFDWKALKTRAYVYTATPLLSLPYIWQRILSQGTYENPSNLPVFSVQAFIKHGKIFLQNFLNLNLDLPYAGFLNLAAVVIIGYGLKQFVTKKSVLKPFQKYFGFILLLCVATIMVIVLSHHFGRYDRPTQARLFMYFSVFCALTPVFLMALDSGWLTGKKLMIASIVLFLFYHPVAGKHVFINNMVITRIHQHSVAFLKNSSDHDVLIISAYAGQFTPLNYGAVTFQYANHHRATLLAELAAHRYSKILVLQEIDYTTGLPKWENQRLDSHFRLQPLQEIQVFDDRYLRISALVL